MATSPWFCKQFYGNNGKPAASGWLYAYAAGTLQVKPIFEDVSLSVPAANPMRLDGNGIAPQFFTESGRYDFKVYEVNVVTPSLPGAQCFSAHDIDGDTSGSVSKWIGSDYIGRYSEAEWKIVDIGTSGKLEFWAYSGTQIGLTATIRLRQPGTYQSESDGLLLTIPITKTDIDEPVRVQVSLVSQYFGYATISGLSETKTVIFRGNVGVLTGEIQITAEGPHNGTAVMFNRLEYSR